ncbi:MAG: OmpA family protein, partial [Cyanobacteria bacterium J06598_3]
APPIQDPQNSQRGKRSKLLFWKKAPPQSATEMPGNGSVGWPAGSTPADGFPEGGFPEGTLPAEGFPAGEAFPVASAPPPRLWQSQPYNVIAYTLAIAGTVTGAWFFGILVAQFLPGNITQPPLQEALLRKSSRLARSLWNLPELWQTPTAQTRIEAIPLPETGPVLAPISLSPIERQPLIDELNAIETEIITLDRRLQGLEKKLGKPPYQGADIDNRVKALRGAIDPLPRGDSPRASYTPTPQNPVEVLLEVAEVKITLPSDALFMPGQAQLREAALLNQVLDQLVNYPEATIVVRSYSDDQANALDSRGYTLTQANALGDYLQSALPSQHRWVTIGAGRSEPVVSNDNEVSRQQNRRIEILVDTR